MLIIASLAKKDSIVLWICDTVLHNDATKSFFPQLFAALSVMILPGMLFFLLSISGHKKAVANFSNRFLHMK